MKVVYDFEKSMYTVTLEPQENTFYIKANSDSEAKSELIKMVEMLFDSAVYNNITINEVIDYFRSGISQDVFSEKIKNYVEIAINALEKYKKSR